MARIRARHVVIAASAACAALLGVAPAAFAAGTSGTGSSSTTGFGPGEAASAAGAVPSVDILPAHSSVHGPNKGLWFVYRADKGAMVASQAILINPAYVPQTVTLSARELDFGSDDTPTISTDPTAGVGSWVHFAQPTIVVPARSHRTVNFTIDVPTTADPGDTTGTLIATGAPTRVGTYGLITRTATRLYVTVPGKVITGFTLSNFTHHVGNPVWPGNGTATVTMNNTGSVRFVPHITLNGAAMAGSTLVVSRSSETYTASFTAHWYGGPVHERIVASADGKDTQVMSRSFWVIPWTLIAIAVVALLALVHLTRYLLRWRSNELAMRRRLADLEAEARAETDRREKAIAARERELTRV